MSVYIVDCEAPFDVPAPSMGDMTEFGAVKFKSVPPYYSDTFHGVFNDGPYQVFKAFDRWLTDTSEDNRKIFVSDNPAYDWQWINFYFWALLGRNPFGFSARRIGDFYAGLTGNFRSSGAWKKLRITPHDHNPVNDAIGNAEALGRLLSGERP